MQARHKCISCGILVTVSTDIPQHKVQCDKCMYREISAFANKVLAQQESPKKAPICFNAEMTMIDSFLAE